jgi:hypothetical protein
MLAGGPASPADPFGAAQAMQDPRYWLVNLLTLVLTMWTLAALYLKEHAMGTDQEMTLGTALQKALGRALPLMLMMILFAIALAVGLVLLIIPGLILMVSLMFGMLLVVFEGQGPVAALTGSHRLVWGNWWRTAAILTVGFIIISVFYFAAGLVVGLAVPLFGIENISIFGLITGLLIAVLMSVVITPFYVALLIAVYWDLKLRKQGGDLAARVGALGAA